MTKIWCNRRDCVWCDPDEGICLETLVRMTEDGCQSYDTIFERPEYQEVFWIAVGGKGKAMFRVERMGKRIEYRGRVFYTVEQTDERESFIVTDGITGAEVGTFGWVKKHWDAFLAAASRYPDVMSYPPAEIVDGKCIPVTDEPEEEKTLVLSSREFTGLLDSLKKLYGGGGHGME
jgi:hypothetical protein